jgi:hypothetical protein
MNNFNQFLHQTLLYNPQKEFQKTRMSIKTEICEGIII